MGDYNETSRYLEEEGGRTAKDALMQWARRIGNKYPGVNVRDMTTSWRDGLAFNAILHMYRPDIINWREVRSRMNTRQRLDHAFDMAEHEFGVTKLLDPEDMGVAAPDERSVITYISTLYDALPDRPAAEKYDRDINDYRAAARDFLQWVYRTTRTMHDRSLPFHLMALQELINEIERFKATDLPPRLREKQHLEQIYMELQNLFADTAFLRAIEDELSGASLERAWQQLLASISEREHLIMERHGLRGNAQDISRRLLQDIGATNEKLDTILTRIGETETRTRVTSPRQLKESYDGIIHDLNLLGAPIDGYFRDVESLKSARHAQANEFYKQVFGLHQRRVAYLERRGVVVGADGKFVSMRTDFYMSEEYFYSRETLFKTAEESIEWVDRKLKELSEMPFVEDLKILEENMEKHKVEHRDILDFRVKVVQCIAHQANISTFDSGTYCDLLQTLKGGYAQLRELSTGRVSDLDSLIAFIRSAQIELLWINERDELKVSRNWSDVGQLDLPMLQNYYKQLMHEIELREEQIDAVHNQGAALINQGHPAVYVIEAYLTTMQAQWDWLLSLTQCLEIHLQDALNTQQFVENAQNCEQWMEKQMQLISTHYDRGDFTLDEGERMLRELEEIRETLDRYHDILLSLIERSRIISPLWQRGERITRPLPVIALCNYQERNIQIRKNDECMLVDNSDMIKWMVRTPEGVEGVVPSVVFRMPPPDERLLSFLQRLQTQFDRLRRSWTERQRMVRFTMISNTMRTIRGWDLKQFMASDLLDQREAIINAMRDDTNKLLAELNPNDPLAQRLREELRLTNEHFCKLLQAAQRTLEPELSDKFDEEFVPVSQRIQESRKTLNDRVGMPLPRDIDMWAKIREHKAFEDSLQALGSDVSMLHELFRQLDKPSAMQRTRIAVVLEFWEDLSDSSRMFAERLKALELVLNGLTRAVQIVSKHEITLASFISMPSRVDELRGVHSQLLEIECTLPLQQTILDGLARNVGRLRQHVARTRSNVADHPDVDRLGDDVKRVTVRWENICMQVIERLKSAELSLQSLMIYRATYESEVAWLDRVEATINQLRNPQDLRAEEYQEHLDSLMAEYAHLNERTQATGNVNLEGGKYILDARVYDNRLSQYKDSLDDVHKGGDSLVRQHASVLTPGADLVAKELDESSKRFAQLSSIIYQRRNDLQLLMQKYQQMQFVADTRLSLIEERTKWTTKGRRKHRNHRHERKINDALKKVDDMVHKKTVEDSTQENKPLVDCSNKSGAALNQLCNSDDSNLINDVLDQLNGRSELAREQAQPRGNALNDALQQSPEVADQLDNVLDSLAITVDRVRHPEPVAVHTDRLREQVQDNSAVRDEFEQKHDAYKNMLAAAEDILRKAGPSDPAVSEIKGKMDTLDGLWNEILSATEERGRRLDDTLVMAQKFWGERRNCEEALKSLQQRMHSVKSPGCTPNAIKAQRVELAAVEASLHAQTPKVDACRETGQQLLRMVGESKKPELQHHLDELNNAWETVTAAIHRRHDDLIEAMERTMSFHEMLGDVTENLSNAETRFQTLEPISSNLLELQEQIEKVAAFKNGLDQQAVVLQQLNQRCDHLAEGRRSKEARAIKRPMQDLNHRWDQLSSGVRQRRDKLDEAYVKAGHFQQSLLGIIDWFQGTLDDFLSSTKAVGGLFETARFGCGQPAPSAPLNTKFTPKRQNVTACRTILAAIKANQATSGTPTDMDDVFTVYRKTVSAPLPEQFDFVASYLDTIDRQANPTEPIANILLAHGTPGDHRTFNKMVPALDQKNIRCVVPNFPGHGMTAGVQKFRHTNEERTEFLLDFMAAIGLARTDLFVGYSSACYIGLKIAADVKYQKDGVPIVNKMIFLNPGGMRTPHKSIRPYDDLQWAAYHNHQRYYGWIVGLARRFSLRNSKIAVDEQQMVVDCMANIGFSELPGLLSLVKTEATAPRILVICAVDDPLVEMERNTELIEDLNIKHPFKIYSAEDFEKARQHVGDWWNRTGETSENHAAIIFGKNRGQHDLPVEQAEFINSCVLKMLDVAE